MKLEKLLRRARNIFTRKKGVLVYAGLHKGDSFGAICEEYKACYGFEADPDLFAQLQIRFRNHPNVHLFNVAVADHDGEIDFNISSNGGASSSIGHFSEDWENHRSGKVTMVSTVKIPCVNLYSFLQQRGIDWIDDYVSDIQGFDLEALKTLRPYIDQRKIASITSEVNKNKYGNIYSDLPDNSEQGFDQLLEKNYTCVAKGWGILVDGEFSDVPESWWEMDCRWKLKTNT